MPIPRILIVVEGGVVQDVISDTEVHIFVKDFDQIKSFNPEKCGVVKPIPADDFNLEVWKDLE